MKYQREDNESNEWYIQIEQIENIFITENDLKTGYQYS